MSGWQLLTGKAEGAVRAVTGAGKRLASRSSKTSTHSSKTEMSLCGFLFFPCSSLPSFAISYPFHFHSRGFVQLILSSQNKEVLPVLLRGLTANVTPSFIKPALRGASSKKTEAEARSLPRTS